MFHRSIDEESKNFILSEFKTPDSAVRVVIATSSFEMGLDFPDVSLIINYSLPRSLESFSQQSGRGGRGISQAFSLVVCDRICVKGSATKEIREYTKPSNFCRRKLLKDHFELKVVERKDVLCVSQAESPQGCRCCDFCRKVCECGSCLVRPWDVSECSSDMAVDLFDDSGEIIFDEEFEDLLSFSKEKVELLRTNIKEFHSEMLEEEDETPMDDFWTNILETMTNSCSYIFEFDDLLTETRITDMKLAKDLYHLLEEVRDS
eukprot:Seg4083.2 transcript_id=Seg4083.2/GoldUCD/mRNA.D3Y31 product="Bloom syndrome protein" protein_id=Seg4083.2/GoldUCD/D3Y31